MMLGLLYCWTAVKSMPGNQGRLFPVYAKSAAWSLVPPMPSFGKHRTIQTHRFLMPDGSTIEGLGIKPDVEIALPADAYQEKDPTLEKALELLREKIARGRR